MDFDQNKANNQYMLDVPQKGIGKCLQLLLSPFCFVIGNLKGSEF